MYRKFSWLHARLLLHRQDELVELQEELERLDILDEQDDPQSLISRRRGDVTNPRRKDILQEVEKKLSIYGPAHHHQSTSRKATDRDADEMLLRFQQIDTLRQPTRRDQNSLYNLIHNTGSLPESELRWIRHKDDLAALARDQEHGWLNGFLEDAMNKISRTATVVSFPQHSNTKKLMITSTSSVPKSNARSPVKNFSHSSRTPASTLSYTPSSRFLRRPSF